MKHCIGIGRITLNHITFAGKLQSGYLNGCCRMMGRSGYFCWSCKRLLAVAVGAIADPPKNSKMCNVVGCCSHWLLHRGKTYAGAILHPDMLLLATLFCIRLFPQKNKDLRWQQFPGLALRANRILQDCNCNYLLGW
ncbi:MAG: hypothetical protein R3C26_14660 [Calditrichia bacterium]